MSKVTPMMGLGYKRANRQLAHPGDLHALRRADENFSDLVVLGAICTFGAGTVVWLAFGEAPLFGTYFAERAEYLRFFWGVVVQLFALLFLYWLMDTAPVWPRVAAFGVAFFIGIFVAVPYMFVSGQPWQKAAFALLALYSFTNAAVAIRQALKLAPSPGSRSIGSKFDGR